MCQVTRFQFQTQVRTPVSATSDTNGIRNPKSYTLSNTKYTKTRALLILAAVVVTH